MCWYKKLELSIETIKELNKGENPNKGILIDNQCRKLDQLLSTLKEGIIETYTMMENVFENSKDSEPDVYSQKYVKDEYQKEDSKQETLLKNHHQNNLDELDRVSDQFDGMIRLTLPSKRQSMRLKIFTIVKNFIGKDLTRFSLPICLNEPLSLLQRMSEMAKFIHLLDTAAAYQDPYLKLAYVVAYSWTAFAGTRKRLFKPFNPLLGETYELVGSNFKIYGEQISHHPPIGVIVIETKNYKVRLNSNIKLAFWGKYAEFSPQSPVIVEMKNSEDVYEIWMPKSYVQNVIIGKMYLDHWGTIKVNNRKTGLKCELEFQGHAGWFKPKEDKGAIKGSIYTSESGYTTPRIQIQGNWNEELKIKDLNMDNPKYHCVWKADPEPENWDDIYRFSIFSLQLNKLTPDIKSSLPPTDWRFRPDQRALENGDYELATSEKHRLEEKQRNAKKVRNKAGKKYTPKYFKEVDVKHIESEQTYKDYMPIRDYWQDKASQAWPDFPDIY